MTKAIAGLIRRDVGQVLLGADADVDAAGLSLLRNIVKSWPISFHSTCSYP
jgi:hypothetical protein